MPMPAHEKLQPNCRVPHTPTSVGTPRDSPPEGKLWPNQEGVLRVCRVSGAHTTTLGARCSSDTPTLTTCLVTQAVSLLLLWAIAKWHQHITCGAWLHYKLKTQHQWRIHEPELPGCHPVRIRSGWTSCHAGTKFTTSDIGH